PAPTWCRRASVRPASTCRRRPSRRSPAVAKKSRSEIPLALAVLHRGFGQPVVGPGRPTLGQAGRGHLRDDVLDGGGTGFHGAGARAVADRAVAHHLADDLLAVPRPAPRTRGQPHAVAAKHLALVRVIDGRQLDVLPGDVVP